jgi:hypothetical protein
LLPFRTETKPNESQRELAVRGPPQQADGVGADAGATHRRDKNHPWRPIGRPRVLGLKPPVEVDGDPGRGGELHAREQTHTAGTERPPRWADVLALPGAHLHLYGKARPRPGRKMGHLTITASDAVEAVGGRVVLPDELTVMTDSEGVPIDWTVEPGFVLASVMTTRGRRRFRFPVADEAGPLDIGTVLGQAEIPLDENWLVTEAAARILGDQTNRDGAPRNFASRAALVAWVAAGNRIREGKMEMKQLSMAALALAVVLSAGGEVSATSVLLKTQTETAFPAICSVSTWALPIFAVVRAPLAIFALPILASPIRAVPIVPLVIRAASIFAIFASRLPACTRSALINPAVILSALEPLGRVIVRRNEP